MPNLPVEIYIEILLALPTSKAAPSEPTLLSCLCANTVLRAAALASAVWKAPYRARYTYCVEANEAARHAAAHGDWRRMYVARRTLDREALRLLDEIRCVRAGRHERAREFTQRLSFDVWDALRAESELAVPAGLRGPGAEGVEAVPDAMPRRYWANVLLGVIARHDAMPMWSRIFSRPRGHEVTFEEALAGLSTFFDVSVREVTHQLEEIYTNCLDILKADKIPLKPDEPDYDFWTLCKAVRDVIHQLGFRLAEGPQFYNLMNQFPHAFLSHGHRETIPMSLVYVFVAIANRLGIRAFPANFPGVVQAHIQSPDPAEPPRLLDMRGKDELMVVNATAPWLPLNQLAIENTDRHTRAATPDTMLARAYSNIVMFMRYEQVYAGGSALPWSLEAHEAAQYATSCTVLFETQTPHATPTLPDTKPLDAVAVVLDAMVPELHVVQHPAVTEQCYRNMEEDEAHAEAVALRSQYPGVRYFVGLVFKHATHDYIGCIYGWHPVCDQNEEWIQEMHVDSLTYKRHQPFYHVLADDGQPRYVAQENINPIPPSQAFLPALMKSRSSFSRYFVDVEMDEATNLGRLIPSKELRDAYPEDERFGASWIHGWS